MTEIKKITPPPGFSNLVALDKNAHSGYGIRKQINYGWTKKLNATNLNLVEFARAATDLPIVFSKDSNAEYFPAAVLGLRKDENLFVNDLGEWQPRSYIPAALRRFPFCLVDVLQPDPKVAAQKIVCVQEDQLEKDSDTPLFTKAGDATEHWQPIQKLLEAMDAARQATRVLCKRLDTLDLLVPFDALATPKGGGKQLRLSGMFRVDETRLTALSPKEIKGLMQKNELRAIYAHLISLENFARLMDMAVLRDKA